MANTIDTLKFVAGLAHSGGKMEAQIAGLQAENARLPEDFGDRRNGRLGIAWMLSNAKSPERTKEKLNDRNNSLLFQK